MAPCNKQDNTLDHRLLDSPTEQDLVDLPPPSKKNWTKEEAIQMIHETWDNPLSPTHTTIMTSGGPIHPQITLESRGGGVGEHEEMLGEKIRHLLFHSPPTESAMGLTKEEALKRINDTWDQPLQPNPD